jgi:hypothetical protein
MFWAFLMGYFLMQCETPESRLYKALRIVVRNPGKPYFQNQPVKYLCKYLTLPLVI